MPKPIDMSSKIRISGGLLIVLVTLAVYIPAMRAGFVWDDNHFLTENPLIKAEDGLYRFWFTTEPPDYFPLTSTTLWLEWRLWGTNASGYHVINVILHSLSSLLIWLVLKRLKVPGAWLAAMIFAIHPVNVESVAWITERKNVLPMTFYLLSILWYLKFDTNGRHRWYGLSLGSFLLALLAKTSVVMQPLVLLGCAWWQRHRIDRKDLLRSLPFFALSAVLGAVTVWFQYHRAIGEDIVRVDSFYSRLAVAGKAVWFYLYKAVFPYALSFVYPRWQIDHVSIVSFLPGVLLAALMVLLWLQRNSWGRPFLFGLGYYIVSLLPVLGFFNIYFMKYSLVADHWQYISIIGIIALWVGLASSAYQSWQSPFRYSAIIAALILVCILSLRSWRLAQTYENVETLWRHTIAASPQCWMAHNNLAAELKRQGRINEAINTYRKALQIKPDFEEAFFNLGNALAAQGRRGEAIKYYYEALRIDPDSVEVHVNLGNALAAQGRYNEALSHYHDALRIKPDFEEAYYNMGKAMADQGKTADAIKYYYEALRIRPDFEEAHYNLANALIEQGKVAEAINHYYEALRVRPDFVEVHISLGNILAAQGKYDEAVIHYSKALQIAPDSAEVHNNLGAALIREGKIDAGVVHFSEALRIRPDYVDAQNNLKNVLEAQERITDKAIKKIQESLNTAQENPALYYQLGNLYRKKGKLNEAIDQYKKAVSIQPQFTEALNNLAAAYFTTGEYNKSISVFKKIIGLQPDKPAAYYNIACIYARQNSKKDAIDWLKKAVEKGYDNWDLIKRDKDLENIRNSIDYNKMINGH
jgi:tetratricopeptide (TPR) repeat protein